MEDTTQRSNEEGRMDAIGSYMAKLLKVDSLEKFLEENDINKKKRKK
jgi:hypothetical protein